MNLFLYRAPLFLLVWMCTSCNTTKRVSSANDIEASFYILSQNTEPGTINAFLVGTDIFVYFGREKVVPREQIQLTLTRGFRSDSHIENLDTEFPVIRIDVSKLTPGVYTLLVEYTCEVSKGKDEEIEWSKEIVIPEPSSNAE